jgi:hypothetical protein
MNRSHNLVALFDTSAILAAAPIPSLDPAHPLTAPAEAVRLIAPRCDAIGAPGAGRLALRCQKGDQLIWRSQALSGAADHSVVLYRIDRVTGVRALGAAQAAAPETLQPVPDAAAPTQYESAQQFDYQLATPATAFGKLIVGLCFYVVERRHSNLSTLGYFQWKAQLVLVDATGTTPPY